MVVGTRLHPAESSHPPSEGEGSSDVAEHAHDGAEINMHDNALAHSHGSRENQPVRDNNPAQQAAVFVEHDPPMSLLAPIEHEVILVTHRFITETRQTNVPRCSTVEDFVTMMNGPISVEAVSQAQRFAT